MAQPTIFAGDVSISAGADTSLYGFGDLSVARNLTVLGTTDSTTKDTGAVIFEGGLGVEKNINCGGNLVASGTVSSGGGVLVSTASNVGTAGVGVFKQKTSSDLEFKKINAGSSKVTITDDTGNSEVDINIAESSIVHQNLSGAGTNTHAQIDTHIASTSNPHSVTIAQVSPLTTKGDILVHNGTINTRQPVGTDTWALTADSGQTTGLTWAVVPGSTPGEANTASNVNTAGVGVFISKVGVDLRFKGINSTTSRLTVTNTPGTNTIDLAIVESAIVHQNLSGAGTNTHAQIDTHIASTSNPHSVTIAQVSPLTTKGDLLVFSTVNTRQPVGANGTVLVADSTTTTGLTFSTVGVFGTQYQSAETLASATTASTTFTERLKLTTPTVPAGQYRIGVSYQWNMNNAANNFLTRTQLDDTTTLLTHTEEAKDPGADQTLSFAGFAYATLTNATHFVDVDFAVSNVANIGTIANVRTEIWRVA